MKPHSHPFPTSSTSQIFPSLNSHRQKPSFDHAAWMFIPHKSWRKPPFPSCEEISSYLVGEKWSLKAVRCFHFLLGDSKYSHHLLGSSFRLPHVWDSLNSPSIQNGENSNFSTGYGKTSPSVSAVKSVFFLVSDGEKSPFATPSPEGLDFGKLKWPGNGIPSQGKKSSVAVI